MSESFLIIDTSNPLGCGLLLQEGNAPAQGDVEWGLLMSENKYQPPVNIPENIPSPTVVQFLRSDGRWCGISGDKLGLCQKDETTVSLAYYADDKLIHAMTFPGLKLVTIEEKKVVVP